MKWSAVTGVDFVVKLPTHLHTHVHAQRETRVSMQSHALDAYVNLYTTLHLYILLSEVPVGPCSHSHCEQDYIINAAVWYITCM